MKRKIYTGLAALVTLLLLITFGTMLTIYTKPMEDISLDLSLSSADNAEEVAPEDFDNKGWTVYTQEGELKSLLEPDGFGGYLGIEPGQTLYFSRVLEEDLDSPTLQLSPADRKFSVWLDNALIYTDCPELENKIGHVTLPMNDWDRSDKILISLPLDYYGKTLTIAQSTPAFTEASSIRAYPTDVILYCGYAYESSLISESFTTAFSASIFFVFGLILLIAMVWNLDIRLLLLALVPFLWMIHSLQNTSFFYTYFGTTENSIFSALDIVSTGIVLLFLALRTGKYRKLQLGITLAYILSVIVYIVILLKNDGIAYGDTFANFFIYGVPHWLGFISFVSLFLGTFCFWHKENSFYQIFRFLGTILVVGYWGILLVTDSQATLHQLVLSAIDQNISYIFYRTSWAITAATLLTSIVDALQTQVNRRMEKRLLEKQKELTLASYENLRRQHEEIMMIRHDMMNHFHTLNDLSTEDQVKSYLEEIIGQNQNVRPIIQSGNQMLDIILNNKLSTAMDAGIKVEIVKVSAPAKLPVTDADLCSLMMNIMDNAISAASSAKVETPYIRLDIHEKNDYLTIVCENSANSSEIKKEAKKETVQKHGLGLKIIRGITKRYQGLFENKFSKNSYKIQIAIPLL